MTGRFSVISTYPPTPCGVATFSAALCEGLVAGGATVEIVRLGDDDVDPHGRRRRAPLNDADVVIVQHEYGLYAGPDGDSVVDVLEALERAVDRRRPHRAALADAPPARRCSRRSPTPPTPSSS